MKLHEHMSDAVADVHIDTETLTRTARDRGGRIRRQRRLATIGGVAAAGILAVGIAAVAPGSDPAPSDGTIASEAPSASEAPEARAEVPIDGRSTAAALRAAVLEVADGDMTAYAAQGGGDTTMEETYAQFDFTPASGGGPGVVGLNVQHATILEGDPFKCTEWMVDCAIKELAGGDRLRTYSEVPVPADPSYGMRVVAEYFSTSRNLRVVASATNGFELPGSEWDVTRDQPVLSAEQLAEVVTADWWDFRLPARFAEEGAELSPYEELDTTIYVNPTEGPKAG